MHQFLNLRIQYRRRLPRIIYHTQRFRAMHRLIGRVPYRTNVSHVGRRKRRFRDCHRTFHLVPTKDYKNRSVHGYRTNPRKPLGAIKGPTILRFQRDVTRGVRDNIHVANTRVTTSTWGDNRRIRRHSNVGLRKTIIATRPQRMNTRHPSRVRPPIGRLKEGIGGPLSRT